MMERSSEKKPKVLMLGWEFPPIINGGLGVACLGLAKALSQYVDLTIIIPKSDPNFIVDNVELIGLNNLDVQELKRISSNSSSKYYKKFAEVETVKANINPYHIADAEYEILKNKTKVQTSQASSTAISSELNMFEMGELYGEDVHNKVVEFSKYAAQIAATKDFDIVYCHDWMTFLAGKEIKAMTGKPLALHVHSLEYDRSGAQSQGWVYQLEREVMHYADIVIPVSKYTGSIAKDHYGVSPSKIFPVHNGAEPVHVFHTSKDFPEKLVVFLGRVTGQKGPQHFLDIAAKVLDQDPNVRFVMAGTGDKLRGLIESGAYKHIGTKFHFTGFLNKEKVHRLFSIADVYCMPSVSEPFGLSALEAAQFGVPCVISKQSGVAEVLNSALKADFWDVNKMSDHINSLLHDEDLRGSVVKNSFTDLESLSWGSAAEKIVGVCAKVI